MSLFRHSIIIAFTFICAALIAGCVIESSWNIGMKAPEVSVLDLNDKVVKLSDFKGNVVALRFWSSACKACVNEMPAIDDIGKKYSGRGMVILAVNIGESKETVERFVKKLNISYPVLLDPAHIAAKKYGVIGVPTTFFIDRNGIAKKAVVGAIAQKEFEKTIVGML